jgi:hypothetical protein
LKGINTDRLKSTGFGETKPISSNKKTARKSRKQKSRNFFEIKNKFLKYLWKTPRFIRAFFFYFENDKFLFLKNCTGFNSKCSDKLSDTIVVCPIKALRYFIEALKTS